MSTEFLGWGKHGVPGIEVVLVHWVKLGIGSINGRDSIRGRVKVRVLSKKVRGRVRNKIGMSAGMSAGN